MKTQNIAKVACLVVGACLSGPAFADLPLTIEDLITDKGKTRLDLSLAYGNSHGKSLYLGKAIQFETNDVTAPLISLPSAIGESASNRDSLIYALGLRYGLTARAEIYGRASALYSQHRSTALAQNSTESHFSDLWTGVSYRFKDDTDTPALLGFAELALVERHTSSTSNFRSAMFGGTAYTSLDPVVLSVTAAYYIRRSHAYDGKNYKPGNQLLLNPSVSFAANDRVTLTTGIQWTNMEPSRIDDQLRGFRQTTTEMQLGIGYSVSKGNVLNLTFKADASGRGGAETRLNWMRTL